MSSCSLEPTICLKCPLVTSIITCVLGHHNICSKCSKNSPWSKSKLHVDEMHKVSQKLVGSYAISHCCQIEACVFRWEGKRQTCGNVENLCIIRTTKSDRCTYVATYGNRQNASQSSRTWRWSLSLLDPYNRWDRMSSMWTWAEETVKGVASPRITNPTKMSTVGLIGSEESHVHCKIGVQVKPGLLSL